MPAQDSGAGQFAVAAQGRLIYVTGGIAPGEERALVWVDRNGTVEPLAAPRLEYFSARLAPNSRRVVVSTRPSASGGGGRLWIHDVARGGLTPLTSQEERSIGASGRPTERGSYFRRYCPGGVSCRGNPPMGPGSSEPLMKGDSTFPPSPNSWSRDGKITFGQGDDIWDLDVSVTNRRARAGRADPSH